MTGQKEEKNEKEEEEKEKKEEEKENCCGWVGRTSKALQEVIAGLKIYHIIGVIGFPFRGAVKNVLADFFR